jgi:hypothetical protein
VDASGTPAQYPKKNSKNLPKFQGPLGRICLLGSLGPWGLLDPLFWILLTGSNQHTRSAGPVESTGSSSSRPAKLSGSTSSSRYTGRAGLSLAPVSADSRTGLAGLRFQ